MEVIKPIVRIELDNEEAKLLKTILSIACIELNNAIREEELLVSMKQCGIEHPRELGKLRKLSENIVEEI